MKDITPGNVNLSAMITGMNPTDERKRNRLLRSELVFEIWAIKKKLIRGTEEKLCCKFGVKMNSWAKECVYEKTTVVPYKDKQQFTVSVTGIMRQPLQGACVKKETLVVHLRLRRQLLVLQQERPHLLLVRLLRRLHRQETLPQRQHQRRRRKPALLLFTFSRTGNGRDSFPVKFCLT